MTFIQLYHRLDACEIPDGSEYLMLISHEVDANGNWIPVRVDAVKNKHELRAVLRDLCLSGDRFVIRCSSNLCGVVEKLGIPMLSSEWGVL